MITNQQVDGWPEPDNHQLVMLGSLLDNEPTNLEIWARDDETAACHTAPSRGARWLRCGDPGPEYVVLSWRQVLTHAMRRRMPVTVLGSGAR